MERITHNWSPTIRHERRNGKDVLIVNVVLIKEGILNGSTGPLLYPRGSFNASDWDGKPILVYHSHVDGKAVSAAHPDVLRRQKVGHLEKCRVKSDRLIGDAVIDPERLRVVDSRVYEKLLNNETIEVSTGLFPELDTKPGIFNREFYDAIVVGMKSDHLAILPDQKGACSREEGCGLNTTTINRRLPMSVTVPSDAVNPRNVLFAPDDDWAEIAASNGLSVLAPIANQQTTAPTFDDDADDWAAIAQATLQR